LYFDDFGAKECTETKSEMKMMGTTITTHRLNIFKDGYQYDLNLKEKTGQKVKMAQMMNAAGIDFSKISDDMMKQMKLKKIGSENYLGKNCDKFSIDNPDMKMKGEYLIYKGILMKMDAVAMGIPTSTKVIKIDENAAIPPSQFDVPQDIKLEEYDMSKGAPATAK
jgi:hypothetical protein